MGKISQQQVRGLIVDSLAVAKTLSAGSKMVFCRQEKALFQVAKSSRGIDNDVVHDLPADANWRLIKVTAPAGEPQPFRSSITYASGGRATVGGVIWQSRKAIPSGAGFNADEWYPIYIGQYKFVGILKAGMNVSRDSYYYYPLTNSIYRAAVAISNVANNQLPASANDQLWFNSMGGYPGHAQATIAAGSNNAVAGLLPGPPASTSRMYLRHDISWVKAENATAPAIPDDSLVTLEAGKRMYNLMRLHSPTVALTGCRVSEGAREGHYWNYQTTMLHAIGEGTVYPKNIPWVYPTTVQGRDTMVFWQMQRAVEILGKGENDSGWENVAAWDRLGSTMAGSTAFNTADIGHCSVTQTAAVDIDGGANEHFKLCIGTDGTSIYWVAISKQTDAAEDGVLRIWGPSGWIAIGANGLNTNSYSVYSSTTLSQNAGTDTPANGIMLNPGTAAALLIIPVNIAYNPRFMKAL